jgi:hypothetical protein
MEIFKVKVKSDGSLDKLKTRLVVRGDLQDKNITEDKWSPTASFWSLKMFLTHASRLKVRVRPLDFVGAFLQAKMRTRMFVTMPRIFSILFLEYEWCTGKPVRLAMSMCGTTLCGKYWYLDLLDFLKELGFKEGGCVKCLFINEFKDGSKIYLLNYVDDMLYHGKNPEKIQEFEKQLGERFTLELLGNAELLRCFCCVVFVVFFLPQDEQMLALQSLLHFSQPKVAAIPSATHRIFVASAKKSSPEPVHHFHFL